MEVRRGAVPWLVFFAPREEVVGARVRKRVVKTKSQNRHSWVAELELRSPRRLGTLRAEKWVELGETNVARYDKADAMSRRAIEVLGIQPSQRNSTT